MHACTIFCTSQCIFQFVRVSQNATPLPFYSIKVLKIRHITNLLTRLFQSFYCDTLINLYILYYLFVVMVGVTLYQIKFQELFPT